MATRILLVLGRLLAGPLDLRRASRDAAVGIVDGPSKSPSPLLHPRKNAIVEYFDCQIPVTQLMGPKLKFQLTFLI